MQKMSLLVFLLLFINIVCAHLVLHVEDDDTEHTGTKFNCDNKRLQKIESDLAEVKENRLVQLEANVTDLRTKLEGKEITKKGCKDGWISFQGSCYFFGNSELSFAAAESFCVSLDNAHLANIESATENTFIRDFLRRLKVMGMYITSPNPRLTVHRTRLCRAQRPSVAKVPFYWFGMTDEQSENVWKHFPSGEQAKFFAWGGGEPNNGRAANCVALWEGADYLWTDDACASQFRPLCEKWAE